jgi:hypothetical protein
MMDQDAFEILRAQGHFVAEPDLQTGRVRVWLRDSDEAIEVEPGRELHELAEGKLTVEEIQLRREEEAAVRHP